MRSLQQRSPRADRSRACSGAVAAEARVGKRPRRDAKLENIRIAVVGHLLDQAAANELHSSLSAWPDRLTLPRERVATCLLKSQLAPVPLRLTRNLHQHKNGETANLATRSDGVLEVAHHILHVVIRGRLEIQAELGEVEVRNGPQRSLGVAHVLVLHPCDNLMTNTNQQTLKTTMRRFSELKMQ